MSLSVAFDSLSFLVVDDCVYMRSIVRTILAGFGARRVHEASDGADGLEQLQQHSPDIVILDWEMPVLDGPEMIRMVRNPRNGPMAFVPIILLTAHTELRRIKEAQALGVHEILRKPVSPKSIHERIVSCVLHPRPFLRTPTYFGPTQRDQTRPTSVLARPEIDADAIMI
jgi:two-component system, chemotaxis family, chemotaxis protein CheY